MILIFIGGPCNGKRINYGDKELPISYHFPLEPDYKVPMAAEVLPAGAIGGPPLECETATYHRAVQAGPFMMYTPSGRFNFKFVKDINTWIMIGEED